MIRVVDAPLATLAVNAVVRAADASLGPVGAISEGLDTAAGDPGAAQRVIQAPLDVGAAVITGGGDLTAEFVLHVVVQSQERPATRDTVRRALASAWHRAEGWQLASVAAALGGFPLSDEEMAAALVETFRDRAGATGFPAELYVVVNRPEQQTMLAPYIGSAAR